MLVFLSSEENGRFYKLTRLSKCSREARGGFYTPPEAIILQRMPFGDTLGTGTSSKTLNMSLY
jgi:hypothetical protein